MGIRQLEQGGWKNTAVTAREWREAWKPLIDEAKRER